MWLSQLGSKALHFKMSIKYFRFEFSIAISSIRAPNLWWKYRNIIWLGWFQAYQSWKTSQELRNCPFSRSVGKMGLELVNPCNGVSPCYGFSLCYGVSPCNGVSLCYGVSPWYGISPCNSVRLCYGVSPCYGVSLCYDVRQCYSVSLWWMGVWVTRPERCIIGW